MGTPDAIGPQHFVMNEKTAFRISPGVRRSTRVLSVSDIAISAAIIAAFKNIQPTGKPQMTTQGVRRYTGDSKMGRKIMSQNSRSAGNPHPNLTKEQREWNAAVDAKKAAKGTQNAKQ